MPRISPYEQQTRAPMPAGQTLDLGSGRGAAGLAQAFESIAHDEMTLRAFERQKAEERAAVWANDQAMRVRSRWLEELQRRQQAAEGAAEGFALAVLADFDAEAEQLIKQAPTEASRNWLRDRLGSVRLGLQQDALSFEARRGVEFKVHGLMRSLDAARTAAEFRPADFAVLAAEQRAAIEASGLPADTRAKLLQDSVTALASAAVQGMIRRDPYTALRELNDEGSKEFAIRALTFEQRQALRSRAETEIRQREAEARARQAEEREILRRDLQDALAARQAGLPAELPSRDRFIAAYGAGEGESRYRHALETFRVYDVVGQAANMPPDEAMQHLAQLRPTQQAGAAEAAQRHELAVRLWEGQRRQLESDPVGTLLVRDPRVRAAFEAMSSGDPAAIRAYVDTVRGAQQALAITQPRLLPASLAEQMAAQLALNPEQPGARAARLAEFAQQWGPAWGDVLREVAPKLDGIGQILPFIPAATAARLDVLSAQRDAVMKALDSTGYRRDLSTAIAEQLAPLNETFPPGVLADGAQVWEQYYQAAELLAADLVRGGTSPERAAEQAVEQLLGSRYEFAGTLRIPRVSSAGEPIIASNVVRGARALLEHLSREGEFLVTPLPYQTDVDAQADRRAQIRAEGFWVTNPDETGAVLALPDGIVLGADGQPIVRTWRELEALGIESSRATREQVLRDIRERR